MPGECRGVDIFEDESEVALQPFAVESGFDVRQVELHLGVGGAVGVVERFAANDACENRMRRIVAGGDDDAADAEFDRFEGEIDLIEPAPCQRFGLRGMKKQFPTYIHATAAQHSFIYISARSRGLQLKIASTELAAFVRATVAVISREGIFC